jgi:uncharacterized phage protein gp47/JayE
MEEYDDNWRDSTRKPSKGSTPKKSRRQTQRAKNQAQKANLEASINAHNNPLMNASMSESSGMHRSFVARRFLDDEGDDLEPDHLDLSTAEERVEGDLASLGTSNASRNNFFEKGSKYNVDQSVGFSAGRLLVLY